VHIVMNLGTDEGREGQPYFTIGILSNDDIRARAVLGVFLGVPPIFHKRSEITLIEGRWRTDSATVMRFVANVHSTVASQSDPGEVYHLKFEPSADLLGNLKPGLDSWWNPSSEDSLAG
jgi:hypothetical protein